MTAGTVHDAEDVMQTVFLKLYQKNPEFNDEEHLKHWLIRVTMNECKRLIASPLEETNGIFFGGRKGRTWLAG